MIRPFSSCVCALNALQKSMMLTPCWPRAGPTGGAGLACPAGICSLMILMTFLAIGVPPCGACAGVAGSHLLPVLRGCQVSLGPVGPSSRRACCGPNLALDLLYLIELELHRHLPLEDRHEHLQLALVLVDLGDLAVEVRQ